MKGRDGNMWIKRDGKWVKYQNIEYNEKIRFKLYNWWRNLSNGGFVVIYKNGNTKLIVSEMKTIKAQINDIKKQWLSSQENEEVVAIIWSSISSDVLHFFANYIIKTHTKKEIEEIIKIRNLPKFILQNYKKYFTQTDLFGKKDYVFKQRYL
jgi:hypothetical protein